MYDEALRQIVDGAPDVAILSLRNLPLDEVLVRVQALPPGTVVFMVRQLLGRNGEAVAHADAVRELAHVARAPIYVSTDNVIGSGAVGGIVISIERESSQLAELAVFGLPDSYVTDYTRKIAAVSKDDIRRVARKYIDPNHLTIVVVGDKKTSAEPLGKLAPVEVRDLEGEPIATP